MKTRYLLIATASLLGVLPGAQAAEPQNAPAKGPVIQTQNLSTKRAMNAEQYAGTMANDIMKKMQGTNTADQINPVMWQRMQASLTAYLHALVADQMGGGGSSGNGPSKGMCMPIGTPICVGGEMLEGSTDNYPCYGRTNQSQCENISGAVRCQDKKTFVGYTQSYGCLWLEPKGKP